MSLLGNRVVRTEDPRFLTGRSTYVADIDLEGAAYVVYVRSVFAHAEITGIDIGEAQAAPGVLVVATADTLGVGPTKSRFPIPNVEGAPVLCSDRVRYVGEPIVAIVAETQAAAVDAAELVIVDYEPLPVVVTVQDALKNETLLHPAIGSNTFIDLPVMPNEISFDDCDVVINHEIVNPRMAAAPMEPRVGAAAWGADGRLTVWAACQGAGVYKEAIKALYELGDDDVRVVAPDVGGGFGAKAGPHREEIALAALAKLADRPVRYNETRSENMVGMVHGRGQVQHIRMGGTKDGRITHYALHVTQDCGAYAEIGAMLPRLTGMMAPGTYDIANLQYSAKSVATNTTPTGAFRGAGRPEAAAAIERAVDLFAAKAGLDPAEVRAKNVLAPFNEPHTTPAGTTYDVGDYGGALAKALKAADYEALRAEQARRRSSGDRLALGIGLSTYVEVTGGAGPDGASEYGSVELQPDGSVKAYTGSTPQGQGHETAWAMLISDELGVAMERIEVLFGDTDIIPSVNVTGGSRSAQVAGSAMMDASTKLATAAAETAAQLLEANVDDVVLDKDAGAFHVVGTPAVAVGWDQVAAASPEPLSGLSDFVQAAASFPFGAHVAVVEVDLDTGGVRLQRLIAVDDCGTILNPLLADGQVHGGLGAGAAQALLEEVRFDDEANPVSSNFADYAVISAAELPLFERVPMETPTPLNPLGAKGIGESGTVGATPAVQNAVIDAVAHLGVAHIDMPCTPQRVWQAINS